MAMPHNPLRSVYQHINARLLGTVASVRRTMRSYYPYNPPSCGGCSCARKVGLNTQHIYGLQVQRMSHILQSEMKGIQQPAAITGRPDEGCEQAAQLMQFEGVVQ
jgi:hypothetical protein